MRQHFLVRQIFLRFWGRGLSVCGTSDVKTHHCRQRPVSAHANEYIHSSTDICPLAIPRSLYHICTCEGCVWGGLSCQWTAWWDSSPPKMSTSPQALGGTHLHGNCNRVAVTEGRTLQPARKEKQTDRQRNTGKYSRTKQRREKNPAFCIILEEEIQSKHFNKRGRTTLLYSHIVRGWRQNWPLMLNLTRPPSGDVLAFHPLMSQSHYYTHLSTDIHHSYHQDNRQN